MRRVILLPALDDAAILNDVSSSKSPSQPFKTPMILWKKEPLKRMLTMMSNSSDNDMSAARPTTSNAPGRQILQLKKSLLVS